MKKFVFLLILLISVGCNKYSNTADSDTQAFASKPRPKNIILMIGDGMGLTQISAGLYVNGNKLNLEKFPIVGLHKPYSANSLITDSAAGATAFASGVKTYNGAIGVNKDTIPVATILEEAHAKGMATGLVATSSITHATPAAFIAHVKRRSLMEEIATFFLKTKIDFFVGGGQQYFYDRKEDDRNLLKELKNAGYFVSSNEEEELTKIAVDYDRKFAYFTAPGEPSKVSEGRNYLLPASKLGTIFLNKRSDKGFFLMIEGAQIDWGGHANDSDYIIREMIDFDRTIGEMVEFAEEDGETLVIVTADHETGGYAINPGSKRDSIIAGFTTESHTASLIPVFAYGPGSELFGGIYENTAIYSKMKFALGLTDNETAGGGR